jgi:hypothetical protein
MRSSSAALVALALAACVDRPQPLLVCHNANCTPDTDPSLDDTRAGLEASLRMPKESYDGLEIDLLWLDRCVLAHDPTTPDPMSAMEVANLIAKRKRTAMLWVELKVTDGAPIAELAACAIDVIARVDPDELVVSSFSPELLDAVAAHPGWRTDGALVAELLAVDRARLDAFHVSGVSIDPMQIDGASLQRFRDLSYDIAVWADAITPELFASIELSQARWVSVADVTLVRSWLER